MGGLALAELLENDFKESFAFFDPNVPMKMDCQHHCISPPDEVYDVQDDELDGSICDECDECGKCGKCGEAVAPG